MKDLVSIVIPVSNSENTIRRCLKSVAQQKYKNTEILIILNESFDKSERYIREYLYKFNNFKLFKISKRNVSRARNFGIRKSKGKYIFFLDSDDLIFENTINDLVNYNRKKNFNLLISAHRQTTGSKRKKYDGLKKNCKFNKKNLIDYYKYFLKYPDIYTAFVHCWSRIYNRKILLKYNIAFNENLNNLEDVNFNLKFINHTKKIGYLNQVTYLHSTEKIHLRSSFDIKSNIIKMIKVTKLNLKKFFLKIDKKNLNKYSSLLNHFDD